MHVLRRLHAATRLPGVSLSARLLAGWMRAFVPIVPALAVLTFLVFACGVPAPAHAEDMRFSLASPGNPNRCGARCPAVITAVGEITDRTPYEFLNFVHDNVGSHNLHSAIFLDSPGGKVVAAMELGRIWRRLGATAIVARADPSSGARFPPGRCESACVYALIGARRRVIPPGSIIGVHRMFFYDDESGAMGDGSSGRRHYDNGSMKAMLSHYTRRMGVSPALISEAERISSDRIHVLTRAEIVRYHLGSAGF